MGAGMASSVRRDHQYTVKGYDVYPPSIDKFVAEGGIAATSVCDAATASSVLVCMAATAQQVDQILFEAGAAQGQHITPIPGPMH
jgi:3-hydroxyisobutyrate dehydrogenase-like beta-hydroxyacid dehydrogenase